MKIGREYIRDLPDSDYLNECYTYNPGSGVLTRKERPEKHFKSLAACKSVNKRFAGTTSNIPCETGYYITSLDYKYYLSHRIIWKMVHGEDPGFIDHIDGDRTNNRISNLRIVSRKENAMNRAVQRNSSTGIHGVTINRRGKKYDVYIKIDKVRTYLGSTKDLFEACCLRKSAEFSMGFHPNHGRPLIEYGGSHG